jgi:hypothetical protein
VTFFERIIGIIIFLCLASLGYLGLRKLWKSDQGWALSLTLIAVFLFFLPQCLCGPYWTGDEIMNFSSAIAGLFSRDFDLVMYPHPALFFNVLIFIYSSMFSLVSDLSSRPFISTGAHLLAYHHVDMLVIARVMALAFWCATCGLLAHIVQKLTKDTFAGVVALLLLATLHESYATQFSPYPAGVFFAYLLLFITVTRKGLSRSWLLAGLLSGLAISSHYLSFWFFVWSFLVFLKDKTSGGFRKVALLCVVASLVFLITNFQFAFHYDDYLAFFRYRWSEVLSFDPNATYEPAHRSSPFLFLRLLTRKDYVSLFALFGGLCALVFAVTGRAKEPLHFLLFAIFLLVVLSLPETRFEQYILFLWPSVVLLCAFFIGVFRKVFPRIGILLGVLMVTTNWSSTLTDQTIPFLREDSHLQRHDPLDTITHTISSIRDPNSVVTVSSGYIAPLSRAISEDRVLTGFAGRLTSSLFYRFGREVQWGTPKASKYHLQVEWMPQDILIQVPKGFVLQDFKRDKNVMFILFKRL